MRNGVLAEEMEIVFQIEDRVVWTVMLSPSWVIEPVTL